MVIFHSYVKLPEGNQTGSIEPFGAVGPRFQKCHRLPLAMPPSAGLGSWGLPTPSISWRPGAGSEASGEASTPGLHKEKHHGARVARITKRQGNVNFQLESYLICLSYLSISKQS